MNDPRSSRPFRAYPLLGTPLPGALALSRADRHRSLASCDATASA